MFHAALFRLIHFDGQLNINAAARFKRKKSENVAKNGGLLRTIRNRKDYPSSEWFSNTLTTLLSLQQSKDKTEFSRNKAQRPMMRPALKGMDRIWLI